MYDDLRTVFLVAPSLGYRRSLENKVNFGLTENLSCHINGFFNVTPLMRPKFTLRLLQIILKKPHIIMDETSRLYVYLSALDNLF